MVVTYNLYNSTIKTYCLLRKELVLADLNYSLGLPFLFRPVNAVAEGIPQNWKKQKPVDQKGDHLALHSVLKVFHFFSLLETKAFQRN